MILCVFTVIGIVIVIVIEAGGCNVHNLDSTSMHPSTVCPCVRPSIRPLVCQLEQSKSMAKLIYVRLPIVFKWIETRRVLGAGVGVALPISKWFAGPKRQMQLNELCLMAFQVEMRLKCNLKCKTFCQPLHAVRGEWDREREREDYKGCNFKNAFAVVVCPIGCLPKCWLTPKAVFLVNGYQEVTAEVAWL